MKDWTDGYVADIGYTYGYYPELNPLRAQWAFLNARLVPPPLPPEGGAACELGFGQGVSAAFHAAASNVHWWGTDFIPAQAAHAIKLAQASGAKASFYDEAFAEFCVRDDLPQFDSIGLHGIWSWVSNENRAIIVDFVRRKLKVGGVLYVSYNTQPGWSAVMPLRHLLTSHAATMGTEGQGILGRIGDSLDFASRLMDMNPAYLRTNPGMRERLDRLKALDKSYLAHEYFNRDWDPMHFAQMAEWLAPAKLSYACSAYLLDHVDGLNLPQDQLKLVNEIPPGTFRETVRDFCINQQFRRDYWVKGARRLSPIEQNDAIRAQRVVLVQGAAGVSLKINGASGEVQLRQDIYEPVLKLLSDHVPRTIGEIAQALAPQSISFAVAREAITVLLGTAALQLCQDDKLALQAKPQTDRLNAYLCSQARAGGINNLASPLTGGVAVSRSIQIFLLARSQGLQTPQEWAQFAWQQFSLLGQYLVKEGKTLATAEENLQELHRQALEFQSVQLPILKALMIA